MPVALSPLEERTLPDNTVTNVIAGSSPPQPVQLTPVTPDRVRSLVPLEPAKQFSDQSVVNSLIKPDTSDPFDKQNQMAMRSMVDWSKNPNAENNQKVADLIKQKNDLDQTGHINTQTQWGGVFVSLLKHDYEGMWKYFNGGPKKYEDAFSPVHGYAVKEFNANGFTGRYFKKNEKGELNNLDPNLINDIEKKGGYFVSKSDLTAMNDARYLGASELAKKAMTGAPTIVMDQYKKSAETANKAGSYANLIQDRQNIVLRKDDKGNFANPWLNAIAHKSPKELAELYRANIEYQTLNQNQSSGAKAGSNANVNLTDTNANKIGGTIGGGFGANQLSPEGGIAPSINGSINGGLSNSASNNVSVGATSAAEAARSSGATNQIQQQFINKVQSIIGGEIKTPEQFSDLQRYLTLSEKINQVGAELDKEGLAPGATPVSQTYDPLLSGIKNITLQDEQGKKNAALQASWEAFLAKKINETNGQTGSRDQLAEEFNKTNTVKGIHYLYDNRKNSMLSNKKHEMQDGDITVNPRTHRPEILRNGKLEPLNER